jgi:phosphate/sulfate permease
MSTPTGFLYIASGICLLMLVWLTIEVGRNDATNIVNAVFGARVMRRKRAVQLAGIAVILGAWLLLPSWKPPAKASSILPFSL